MGVELLASGRTCDVYAVDEATVLRRYRFDHDAGAEADLMTYLRAADYPVPAVYSVDGRDLVMERIQGPTMLSLLGSGDLSAEGGATILAELHHRLHEVPPRVGGPDDRILHLDLHPDNVLLGLAGPVVIDWSNAAEGPAGYDVALSALILGEVVVGYPPEIAEGARVLLAEFVAQAGPVERVHLERALARRQGDPMLTPDEKTRLHQAATTVLHANP